LKVCRSSSLENQNEIKSLEGAVDGRFENLNKSAAAKQKTLEGELQKQKDLNDKLCKDFAEAVKSFTDYLTKKKANIAGNKSQELEQQLASLLASASDDNQADGKLKAVTDAEAKLKARFIANNPHTSVSKGDCDANWAQYKLMFQKKKELLESQIEEKKKSGLTDEQLQEIRENFTYFDKDKTNFLEKRELRACLQSLGESSTPKDIAALLEKYDGDKDGKLKFDEFQKFMFTKLGDTNSREEILGSFKYLAFDKDTITETNLVSVINDVSWKTRHVDYLKKEMPKKNDGYDYIKWTTDAFNR